MIFAGVLVFSTLCAAYVSYAFVRKHHISTYRQIIGVYGKLFSRPTYYGYAAIRRKKKERKKKNKKRRKEKNERRTAEGRKEGRQVLNR